MAIEPITVADLRGGRNGIDSPIDPTFPTNQCCEALNVDFSDGPLGRRRGGADEFIPAGGGGTAFTTRISAMCRWVPSGDETAAELHVVDGATPALVKRLSGTTYTDVIIDDPIVEGTTDPVAFAALNGKLFYAYYAGLIDRLHVYDPSLAIPRIRVVGIDPGTDAPTVANSGAGTFSTTRYYRVRFIQVDGTRVVRRSEPTGATPFTPSGAGQYARVTRPTPPGEGETHWEIDESLNDLTWYKAVSFQNGQHVPIATTFYDDGLSATSVTTLEAADVIGFYTLPPGAKYIVADNNRLLMLGHYANDLTTSRLWYTPVLGSSDQGDDERLYQTATQKPFIDFNEKDGGEGRGLSEPIGGVVLAFKYKRTIRLGPTGDVNTPYLPREISHTIGTIEHDSIVVAEDAEGNPAVYWMSHRGPYRYGSAGLQYLGRDIEDYWRGLNGKPAVNLDAESKVCHGKFYSELGQIWWWIATGISNRPNLKLVLDVRHATRLDRFGVRGGWSIGDGPSAGALCSVMFGDPMGSGYTHKLRPYIGLSTTPKIYACDTISQGDNGTAFQAFVKTRSITSSNSLRKFLGVGDATLTARAVSQGTIQLMMDADYGLQSRPDEASLAPESIETRVVRTFLAAVGTDLGVVQMQIGDPAAVLCDQWSLDSITVDVSVEGDR